MGRNRSLRVLMAELRRECGNRCQFCGSTLFLEWMHWWETPLSGSSKDHTSGRGGRQRYLDIKNHPHCYILACRSCHRGFETAFGVTNPPLPAQLDLLWNQGGGGQALGDKLMPGPEVPTPVYNGLPIF